MSTAVEHIEKLLEARPVKYADIGNASTELTVELAKTLIKEEDLNELRAKFIHATLLLGDTASDIGYEKGKASADDMASAQQLIGRGISSMRSQITAVQTACKAVK